MRKIVLLLVVLIQLKSFSQIIYSENFSSQALVSYTVSNGSGSYTTVPNGYSLITDAHNNNIGLTIDPSAPLNPNTPFNYSVLKTAGWVVGYNANVKDTFLVSTSWLDTNSISVDRWVITPPIAITAANTVLRWSAMCPDANYRDGYEVYTTTVTGNVALSDLPLGNRVFAMADNNTVGAGENTQWTNRSVNLDNYLGQTIRFAFRNNSKDRFQLWLDDIQVATVSNSRDVAMNSIDATKYILTNYQDTVRVNFSNIGAALITTVALNYIVGNSAINSQTFTSALGWGNRSSNDAEFGFHYYVTSPGYYPIKTWVSSVNGSTDQDHSNDTAYFYITAQTTNVAKNCLIEQFVSANNGDSPDAQEKTQAVSSSTVIIVNVHDNDSMKISSISNLLNDYKVKYSTALIDRSYYKALNSVAVGKTFYSPRTISRLAAVSPASVTIINKTYNTSNRLLTFTVKADFVGEVKGDYRINAYLTENNVCGNPNDTTINGYNQLNDYYVVPWSSYYKTGYFSSVANSYVINAWYYKHQNVLIHAFDGSYGNPGLIPSSGGTAGQSYLQTYTLTLPTSTNAAFIYREDNVYIVAYVAEGSSDDTKRTVLNSVREKMTSNAEIIGIKENTLFKRSISIGVYPNPSAGLFYLQLNEGQLNKEMIIKISNVLGQVVYAGKLYSKSTFNELDLSHLSNGAYIMEIDLNGSKSSKKLIIQH